MKKLVIVFILLFNIYKIYASNNNLKNIKIEHKLEIEEVALNDALAVISKEYDIAIVADSSSKDIPVELYFPKGTSLQTVVDALTSIYNLKIKEIGDTLVLSKRIKNAQGEISIAGKVLVSGYKNGIEGVKVTILKSNVPATYTTFGGNFVITDLDPGVYVAKFEKEGYVTLGEIVNLESSNTSITVSLEKDNGRQVQVKEKKNTELTGETTIIDGEKYCTEKVKIVNMSPEELKTILESTYEGLIRVTSTKKSNLLILFGKREIVQTAKNLIKDLDGGIKQVRVSSQILDVSDNLFEELGFDWVYSNNGEIANKKGTNGSLLGTGIIDGIGTNFASKIGIIRQFNSGKDMLGVGINLLQATQDLVISAIPSILIVDGEEGEFKITEEVIVGEEKNENDETSKTTYTPLFREAGIILKVTPIIQDDDSIVLKVKIEVSNFKLKKTSSSEEVGTYNAEGGSKVGRTIETTVKMKNGETIFIGGLKRAIVHNLQSKVPGLGDIPVLGNIFKNKSVKSEVTDIYVKLKVDVAGSDNENEEFENMELHQKYEKIKNRKVY